MEILTPKTNDPQEITFLFNKLLKHHCPSMLTASPQDPESAAHVSLLRDSFVHKAQWKKKTDTCHRAGVDAMHPQPNEQ